MRNCIHSNLREANAYVHSHFEVIKVVLFGIDELEDCFLALMTSLIDSNSGTSLHARAAKNGIESPLGLSSLPLRSGAPETCTPVILGGRGPILSYGKAWVVECY